MMEIKEYCPHCGGRGGDHIGPCLVCGGTGIITVIRYGDDGRPPPPPPPPGPETLEELLLVLVMLAVCAGVIYYATKYDNANTPAWAVGGLAAGIVTAWMLRGPFRFILVMLRWVLMTVFWLVMAALALLVLWLLAGGGTG